MLYQPHEFSVRQSAWTQDSQRMNDQAACQVSEFAAPRPSRSAGQLNPVNKSQVKMTHRQLLAAPAAARSN
jgi:hypothetical protein